MTILKSLTVPGRQLSVTPHPVILDGRKRNAVIVSIIAGGDVTGNVAVDPTELHAAIGRGTIDREQLEAPERRVADFLEAFVADAPRRQDIIQWVHHGPEIPDTDLTVPDLRDTLAELVALRAENLALQAELRTTRNERDVARVQAADLVGMAETGIEITEDRIDRGDYDEDDGESATANIEHVQAVIDAVRATTPKPGSVAADLEPRRDASIESMPVWCGECGKADAETYVVTFNDGNQLDPEGRTELCLPCHETLTK